MHNRAAPNPASDRQPAARKKPLRVQRTGCSASSAFSIDIETCQVTDDAVRVVASIEEPLSGKFSRTCGSRPVLWGCCGIRSRVHRRTGKVDVAQTGFGDFYVIR